MTTPRAAPTVDPAAYRRSLIAAAVPTLAVPVVLGGMMLALGLTLRVGPFVAGAVGWLIALMLRGPVAIAAEPQASIGSEAARSRRASRTNGIAQACIAAATT